jgi:hypothetical protein
MIQAFIENPFSAARSLICSWSSGGIRMVRFVVAYMQLRYQVSTGFGGGTGGVIGSGTGGTHGCVGSGGGRIPTSTGSPGVIRNRSCISRVRRYADLLCPPRSSSRILMSNLDIFTVTGMIFGFALFGLPIGAP